MTVDTILNLMSRPNNSYDFRPPHNHNKNTLTVEPGSTEGHYFLKGPNACWSVTVQDGKLTKERRLF
jgi:hypothetical protein